MNNKDLHTTNVVVPIKFPLKDGTEYTLGVEKIQEYIATYKNIDVLSELMKCRMWNIDHPKKRKTLRGAPAHISGWLARADSSVTMYDRQNKVNLDWRSEYE